MVGLAIGGLGVIIKKTPDTTKITNEEPGE